MKNVKMLIKDLQTFDEPSSMINIFLITEQKFLENTIINQNKESHWLKVSATKLFGYYSSNMKI